MLLRARFGAPRLVTAGAAALLLLAFAPVPASATIGPPGHGKLDEGSGTIAGDSSGFVHDDALVSGQTLRVGAYYYAWYGSDRHWRDGYLRGSLSTAQTPALGEYDSRAAPTIESHFRWAQQYGVDSFVCSWWGAESYRTSPSGTTSCPRPPRARRASRSSTSRFPSSG